MRAVILLTIIIINAGCTTLRPIEGNPAELQQRLRAGELLEPGDRVLIVSSDQKSHRFRVTSMGPSEIVGKKDSVAVAEVVSLQKRQFSRGKTIALVAGIAGGCAVAGLFIYAATHIAVFAFD